MKIIFKIKSNNLIKGLLPLLILFTIMSCNKSTNKYKANSKIVENTEFYQFKAKSIYGRDVSMTEFKDKVILIVNTASECGFTYQYDGLEKLYKKYKDKNFIILGFPSNQFGKQEPGTDAEIANFCKVNHGVTFPLFSKINVNGDNAHPLYKYLKKKLPSFLGESIKWNFTKFLIDSKGHTIERYGSTTKPKEIEKDIKKLLVKYK
jgi:glutathione peroxidase